MTVYNSGITSNTTIVNGVAYTQNVINLGGTNACSAGPEYCQDGYSLYVPCLKNITRGQNVCFQVYIADKENQDTLDLDRLCGLTLDLSGPYGCPYGSYTWPDDIKSLQGLELSELKCNSFDGNIYRLDLGFLELDGKKLNEIDIDDVNKSNDGFNVNVQGVYGDFYKGETPYLIANDSPTHIFVGWTTDERFDELCENFTIDDVIVSREHEWKWEEPIDRNMSIYAIYRKRKKYRVMVSFDNRHSYFMVTYNGKTTMLSDKQRDYVEVLEGYHFIATCVPIVSKDKDGNITHTYTFYKWNDGYPYQKREYLVEDKLFKNDVLRLYAICGEDKITNDKNSNFINDITPTEDIFETNLPDEHKSGYMSLPFSPNEIIYDFDGVKQIYDPENKNNIYSYISLSEDGFITFDFGDISGDLTIKIDIDTSNLNLESTKNKPLGHTLLNMLKRKPHLDRHPEKRGELTIKNNTDEETVKINTNDDNELVFTFKNCTDGIFTISTNIDDLHIVKICVYQNIITNKGLVELCVPPEDTLKFYRGILNMSGAICVDGNWFGLDSVQVGVVNKLNPINITIE